MPGLFDLPGAPQAPTAPDFARQSTLYDPDNAQFALQNAMLAQGYNPFSQNIFNQFMRRLAPGLGMAFNVNQAMQPGMTPANAGLQQPGDFQNFLSSILSNGSAIGALQGASSAIGGGTISDLVNAQNASLAGGGSLVNANPFISMLEQMLGSGGGKGAIDVLQVLNSPLMGRGMASGYQQNLNNSLGNSIRAQVNAPGFGTPEDQSGFLQYLLGTPNNSPPPVPQMQPSPQPPATAGFLPSQRNRPVAGGGMMLPFA